MRLLVELGSFYEKVVKVKADVSGSGCNLPSRLGDGKRGGAQSLVLAPILDSTEADFGRTLTSALVRKRHK